LLDAQAISDIDITAVETMHALHKELAARGIDLKIAHANPPLRKLLQSTGLAGEIGENSFYGSVHECVEQFTKEQEFNHEVDEDHEENA
jgi:MFS superfamily sulfate permease-like transporter